MILARESRLYVDFDILTVQDYGPVSISKSIYSLNSRARMITDNLTFKTRICIEIIQWSIDKYFRIKKDFVRSHDIYTDFHIIIENAAIYKY